MLTLFLLNLIYVNLLICVKKICHLMYSGVLLYKMVLLLGKIQWHKLNKLKNCKCFTYGKCPSTEPAFVIAKLFMPLWIHLHELWQHRKLFQILTTFSTQLAKRLDVILCCMRMCVRELHVLNKLFILTKLSCFNDGCTDDLKI